MLPPTEVFKACPRFVDTDQGRLVRYLTLLNKIKL